LQEAACSTYSKFTTF